MLNPVLILLGLTVAISAYAWSNDELMESWILRPYRMARDQSQWYRFLTCGFLHADWMHLIFNMLAFFSFGQTVLQAFSAGFGAMGGVWRFLVLYLGGIILSSIPSYLRHRDDRHYGSLGASGGVAAVLFSGVLFDPISGIGFIFLPGLNIPGFIFGVLYLIYSYYQGRRGGDNINHDAHFYGALYGVIITLVLFPGVFPGFLEAIQGYVPFK